MQPATTTKASIALLCYFTIATAFTAPGPEMTTGFSLRPMPFSGDTIVPRKKPSYKSYDNDKNEYHIGDINIALKELDRAIINLNNNIKVEMPDIQREIKAALAEVNKIDFDVINREIRASIEKVDWKQIKAEINDALKEVKVDLDETDKKEINEAIGKAKLGIEKAKKNLTKLKEFTDSLEKDQLINKKKGYKIELKGADMYINGVKQPNEVSNKYRKYFKEKDYTISSDGEEISSIKE